MPVQTQAIRVVARYRDHRIVKGTTQDFFPKKPVFHLHEQDAASASKVEVAELKALFFVKTFEGDKDHHAPEGLENAEGSGRKLRVVFEDGETMIGFTMGYNKTAPGFFLVPADTESNNERVFVVNAAVSRVEWL
jgi:hypothetical protein